MIPEWVNKYVGIPFLEHGRSHAGVDCYGLVKLIYNERFGLIIPSYDNDYETVMDGDGIQNIITRARRSWEAVSDARLGDVVLFHLMRNQRHVGMVVEPGTMIHVERGADTVVERYDRMAWNRTLRGIYRHGGVTMI